MNVTFLGTGTSHGIPMIGCDCPVCSSDDPRNTRTRSSVLIDSNGTSILIDTPPELRIQAIRENIRQVDAVLFTHAHADHIFGLDDVRRFNDLTGKVMDCRGLPETLKTIRRAYEYVFVTTQAGGGKPSLRLIEVDGRFDVGPLSITPVPAYHGEIDVLGYRIGDFAYLTDASRIPPSSMELLTDLDVLVLGALRHKPHDTHFCLSEAVSVVEELNPKRAFFTHIAHKLDHESTNAALPANVRLAHDGLRITVP